MSLHRVCECCGTVIPPPPPFCPMNCVQGSKLLMVAGLQFHSHGDQATWTVNAAWSVPDQGFCKWQNGSSIDITAGVTGPPVGFSASAVALIQCAPFNPNSLCCGGGFNLGPYDLQMGGLPITPIWMLCVTISLLSQSYMGVASCLMTIGVGSYLFMVPSNLPGSFNEAEGSYMGPGCTCLQNAPGNNCVVNPPGSFINTGAYVVS